MASPANATKSTLLPPAVVAFAQRRTIEIAGIAVALLGCAVALALLSYHPGDPSLNAATEIAARNWLGGAGASTADILMQTMGLAAWLLPIILLAWGWRIGSHRGLARLWLRISLVPIALLLAALALASPEAGKGWILNAGYGGITGDMLLIQATTWIGRVAAIDAPLVALAGTLLAIAALVGALGFSAAEWRQLGQWLLWLGHHSARSAAAGGRLSLRLGRWSMKTARSSRALWRRREPVLAADRTMGPAAQPAPATMRSNRREPPPMRALRSSKENLVAPKSSSPTLGKRAEAARQKALDLGPTDEYVLPSLDLLESIPMNRANGRTDADSLAENARLLESVLEDFGVQGEVVKVRPGPVVTLYEFEPAPGIKSSRVIGLADDVARSMSAISVRIAVIPGRTVMGIELPNADREIVSLRELLSSEAYERTSSKLSLVLGKDIGGTPVIADLTRMPHLLIAGTTGSGKSVAINTMIASLLYHLPPEKCRLVMIDPKMLELSVYDGIPHLLCPVVTDPKKAVVALRWTVREMEQRYRAMSTLGVRNIAGYNARLEEATRTGEVLTRTVQTGFDADSGEPVYEEQPLDMTPLPFIVMIVDEMADLMLVAGKEVEGSVQRIAQMARAAGIHLIMATQRPSVDVITGTIKANFPTRVSFQVTSKIDSRTILGEQGAEQLLGQGDMLYMAGGGRITRVHGPFVSDDEVELIVSHLKDQGMPTYIEEVTIDDNAPIGPEAAGGKSNSADALYDEAVAIVAREGKASTSFIQRHLQIGYNRAARIIEQMEKEGVISPANRVGRREVLVGSH
ncbi:MAG: cell division protein FtsK [Rhodospirillaceae bacterium]|nr:cell division protein FtsK [Rhodospirillaceae bacterium]